MLCLRVVDLTPSRKLKVRLRQGAKRPSLSLEGLDRYKATAVRVVIYGKRTRMLNNPLSCGRRHKFSADLTTADGERILLRRSLKMCKTRH